MKLNRAASAVLAAFSVPAAHAAWRMMASEIEATLQLNTEHKA